MFFRNTEENALPANNNNSQASPPSSAGQRRPTLEQIMLDLNAANATLNEAKLNSYSKGVMQPQPVQSMNTAEERRPRPSANAPTESAAPSTRPPAWRPAAAHNQPAAPLRYNAPAIPNKVVPAAPMDWKATSGHNQSAAPARLPQSGLQQPGMPALPKPVPDELIGDLVRTADYALPGEVGDLLPLELVYAIKAQANKVSIHQKLQQYCKRESHNPLLELPSGTVAFIALEDSGKIRVFIGNMRDFSLFCVRTNMLDGTLALEEMYEYQEVAGQVEVVRKRASEIGPSQIAGRKMHPVLQFMSYTIPGYGKATYQVKSEWR